MNFNKTILVGKLVRDNELKMVGETAIINNAIASNRAYSKDGEKVEEVTFVDFSIYGRLAEILNEYTGKGDEVLLEGRLVNDRWESNGEKRSKLTLKVDGMQLGHSRKQNAEQSEEQKASEPF